MNPHQWSFAKQKWFQIENIEPKLPKQDEDKWDGVMHSHNNNFNQFWYRKFWWSQKRYELTELGCMCPRGLFGPPAVTLTKKLKYKRDFY